MDNKTTKATTLLDEDPAPIQDGWRRLACAIVLQAQRDYFEKKDWLEQLDAALWLRDEARYYFEMLDMEPDIMGLLTGPKPSFAFRTKGE